MAETLLSNQSECLPPRSAVNLCRLAVVTRQSSGRKLFYGNLGGTVE